MNEPTIYITADKRMVINTPFERDIIGITELNGEPVYITIFT